MKTATFMLLLVPVVGLHSACRDEAEIAPQKTIITQNPSATADPRDKYTGSYSGEMIYSYCYAEVDPNGHITHFGLDPKTKSVQPISARITRDSLHSNILIMYTGAGPNSINTGTGIPIDITHLPIKQGAVTDPVFLHLNFNGDSLLLQQQEYLKSSNNRIDYRYFRIKKQR